ncbi:uncharacterized protein [Choristoneura fumiferana]|uniref:uncharacterized protein n=1 Tax=Choristoneura fumiferana TaxID=7141 RepID=UPI003D15ABF8
MGHWNCCRTCLGVASLNPIFLQSQHSAHYTNVIFIATGIKVQINDSLPQKICRNCINIINQTIKFRKKCEQAQATLKERLNNKLYGVKLEAEYKSDLSIDISEYIDDDFKDYDDNITLNALQSEIDAPKEDDDHMEYETKVEDISTSDIFDKEIKADNGKRSNVKKIKEVKKRSKKKEDSEKVKEEIECEYCHKILTSKLSIRNHYKIHTGFDVVCEHCGKKFITRRLLLMHCRAKHGYEKTDKCSYCDYRASNAEQVKIHERLHTGEKPYVCGECGAGFHRKSSYLQHVAIHLPEKTVQCAQCPARFKSVTLMRIHAARHRAPRYSFQCALCDNSFARRRNVARHVQRIHGLPPEPHTICRKKIA